MKEVTFLLIDNANFGSIVMEYMRGIYPDIHKNLNEKDLNYNLFDHPHIIDKYINTYLYIVYYFTEYYGIPLSNIIFFRDCNHSSNWRKKIIPVYKDGKSRFADSSTFEFFGQKDKLKKELDDIDKKNEEDKNSNFEKWKLEDQIDDLKIEIKRKEKFIHELSSIERFIHFYLNDNLCSLTDRNVCEADEQMFIFSYYLMTEYPNCNIKILSNDTDMIQCLTSNQFIHEMMSICNRRLNCSNTDRTVFEYNPKQIQIFKCLKHSTECFTFKNLRDLYKQHVLENFIIHKVCCGKHNDNLPDPSNNNLKLEWFNTTQPDVYKNFHLNKEKCLQSIMSNTTLAKNIKNNILCSSFFYLTEEILDKVIQNCKSIENKVVERDGGFKPLYSDISSGKTFMKVLPDLKSTVRTWLEESLVRNLMDLLINDCTKFVGRCLISSFSSSISDEELNCFIERLMDKFSYEIKRCKKIWLKKYINLWMLYDNEYVFDKYEFKDDNIKKDLTNFTKETYLPYIEEIKPYIFKIGMQILSKI
jgi:hypothetical protein